MRHCSAILLATLFLLGTFFSPSFSQADESNDVFSKSVGEISLKDAPKAADGLIQTVAGSPVFSSLGLSAPKFLKENSFSVDSKMKVFGSSLSFKGEMKVNPTAVTGELLAKYTGTLSVGNLSIGTFDSKTAALDMVIVNDGGSKRVYARISPAFSINNKKGDAVIDISPASGGVAFSAEITGSDLTLTDFMPELAGISALNKFAFDKFVYSGSQVTVAGKINKKAVSVVDVMATPKSYEITGDDLTLADFAADAAKIPVLNKFAFDKFVYSGSQVTIEGQINHKAVSVVDTMATPKSYEITGGGLKLSDIAPDTSGLTFLNDFQFDKLIDSSKQLSVEGKIDRKKVTVVDDLTKKKSYTLTGDDLELSNIIPEASGLKAFDKFALDMVSITPEQLDVSGKISGKSLQFVKYRGAKKGVVVTADDLVLGDVFEHLKSIPALNAVAIEKLSLNDDSIEAEVLLNGVKIDAISHTKKGGDSNYVALFFDELEASTFVPAAKGHAINSVAFDRALFLILPGNASATSVTSAALPGDLPKLVGWPASESVQLSAGVNFAATLDVKKSAALTGVLKDIGIRGGVLSMRGTLSSSTFKAMGGKAKGSANSLTAADQASVLAGLSIVSDIPLPKLPAIADLVKVSGPAKLSINGDAGMAGGIWSRLPESLVAMKPSGIDMTAQFSVAINGVGIREKLDAAVDIGMGQSKELTLIALSKGKWNKPFDIPELALNSGGFRFMLEKSKSSTSKDIAFFGTANLGKHKDVKVVADLAQADGKLSLNYFELDGKFGLKDLPGGKNIPNAGKFELDEIKLSEHGIEAKTKLGGKKVDGYLFDDNGWNFAIDQKNFTFVEFLPMLKDVKPLKSVVLPNAAIILSEKGLITAGGTMPVIAKDMFDDIFGGSNVPVNIKPGIGLIAAFDPAQMGILGKGLSKIGVHEDAIIMGEITGVFGGGSPGLFLDLMMEKMGDQHGLPKKVMSPSAPKALPPAFFILWSGDQVDAGVKLGMDVKAGKDTLELATSIELVFDEEGLGLKLLGEMDGIWHNPFGIPGFSIGNVKMDVEINDVGEVKFGFAGDDQFEKLDIDLAASMSIALEDALPDGVAFYGKVSDLGVDALLEIAEVLTDQPGKLSKIPVPFFAIHDALLAFATPGTADPQLGISEGFAFGGKFFFMGRELGSMLGTGSPNPISGITFKGDIADIDLDVLVFKKNNIDIAINLQPKWIMNSQIEILGGSSDVMVNLQPPHFEFDVTEEMGDFGFADLRIRMDGFDLTTGVFDKNADISVIGELKSNLVPKLEKEIKQGLDDLRKSADAKLDADLAALKAAKAKVDQLNQKIQTARAEDKRAKDRAELKLEQAKKRVHSLKSDYDHDEHEKKHCGSKWTHWACSGYWATKGAATYAVYKVAEDVLTATEKAVAAAYDLDPRVASLIAERDIELAGLAVAQGVVEASKIAEDFVTKELEKVLETALKDFPFDVEKAIIIGDLRGMIANDDPLVIDMKFRMFGTPMHEYFAIKLEDPAFDAIAFALLPALALDAMTESVLKKLDPKVATWVHAHIAGKLAQAEAKVREQVQAEEAKYKDVLASFENGNAKFRKAFQDQADAHTKIVSNFEVTDLMGDSKRYAMTYLVVGHSSLCLGVSEDGVSVVQEDCKNVEAEQWKTAALDGDNKGYVQLISKGLCLKARKTNPSQADSEPLILSQCDKSDKHEQWKVISTDGFFDKIANRYSQKCLHFNSENANPYASYAVWTSCTGADSQDFRDIPDAERPTLHSVNAMLKAKNGSCLSLRDGMITSYFTKVSAPVSGMLSTGMTTITKPKKMLMIQKGDEKLVAETCNSNEDRFNYIEAVNGDIKLIHKNSGWCIYPKAGSETSLALGPCDRGKDMTWRLSEKGNAFQLQNLHGSKYCMSLPAMKKGSVAGTPTLASCTQSSEQLFDLVQ